MKSRKDTKSPLIEMGGADFIELTFLVDGKIFEWPPARVQTRKNRVIEIEVPLDLGEDNLAEGVERVDEESSDRSEHSEVSERSDHSEVSEKSEQVETLSRNQKIKLAESGVDLNVQEECDDGDSEDNISLFARFKVKGKKGIVKCIPVTISPESSILQLKSLFAEQLGDDCPITSLKFYHVSYKNATKFGVGDIRTADGKVGRLLDPFHDKKMISTMNIADGDFFEIEMK